jgi:hypothetical protein
MYNIKQPALSGYEQWNTSEHCTESFPAREKNVNIFQANVWIIIDSDSE